MALKFQVERTVVRGKIQSVEAKFVDAKIQSMIFSDFLSGHSEKMQI